MLSSTPLWLKVPFKQPVLQVHRKGSRSLASYCWAQRCDTIICCRFIIQALSVLQKWGGQGSGCILSSARHAMPCLAGSCETSM